MMVARSGVVLFIIIIIISVFVQLGVIMAYTHIWATNSAPDPKYTLK